MLYTRINYIILRYSVTLHCNLDIQNVKNSNHVLVQLRLPEMPPAALKSMAAAT